MVTTKGNKMTTTSLRALVFFMVLACMSCKTMTPQIEVLWIHGARSLDDEKRARTFI